MTRHEIITELEVIIDNAKSALLATVDKNSQPHIRWMTPTILKDRTNTIFSMTSAHFGKIEHLKTNSHVEWIFQSKNLDTIINIQGVVNVLDNSSIKNEVLEAIGPRLNVFWKLKADDESNLLVLETVIREAVFYKPMKGVKSKVPFK